MRITRISVYHVNLPLEHPYWLSGGRLKFEVLDATIVKIDTDAGVTGWGEGTPWGHTYVPAHGPGIRAGIETMAPFVLGLDPRNFLEVERAMDLPLFQVDESGARHRFERDGSSSPKTRWESEVWRWPRCWVRRSCWPRRRTS